MSNSLNLDIQGKVVILKEEALQEGYRDFKWRRAYVMGGFGSSARTAGTALMVIFLEDEDSVRLSGYDVERLATDEELEEWKNEINHLTNPDLEDAIIEDFYGLPVDNEKLDNPNKEII